MLQVELSATESFLRQLFRQCNDWADKEINFSYPSILFASFSSLALRYLLPTCYFFLILTCLLLLPPLFRLLTPPPFIRLQHSHNRALCCLISLLRAEHLTYRHLAECVSVCMRMHITQMLHCRALLWGSCRCRSQRGKGYKLLWLGVQLWLRSCTVQMWILQTNV